VLLDELLYSFAQFLVAGSIRHESGIACCHYAAQPQP